MFLGNSSIPGLLNMILDTTFYFSISLMAGIGVGSLTSSQKSDLLVSNVESSSKPWSLECQDLFTFKSLSSRTGRGIAELVHSNDLICHIRAQSIYSVTTISMCAGSRMSC